MTHQLFCQLLPLYNFFFFFTTFVISIYLFGRQMWFYALVTAAKCYFEMQMKLWLRDILEKAVLYDNGRVGAASREGRCLLPFGPWVMYHWTTTRAARGCSRTHAVRIVTSVALTTFTSRRTCCFLAPFNPSLRKIHDFFVCVTRGHCGVLR